MTMSLPGVELHSWQDSSRTAQLPVQKAETWGMDRCYMHAKLISQACAFEANQQVSPRVLLSLEQTRNFLSAPLANQ